VEEVVLGVGAGGTADQRILGRMGDLLRIALLSDQQVEATAAQQIIARIVLFR